MQWKTHTIGNSSRNFRQYAIAKQSNEWMHKSISSKNETQP